MSSDPARDPAEKQLYAFVLSSSVELTESRYGFVGFIDENQETLTMESWSPGVHRDCRIHGKRHELPLEGHELLAKPVREKSHVLVNDFGGERAGRGSRAHSYQTPACGSGTKRRQTI